MTDLLTAALDWYDAGYAVIPAHEDGSKRPFGPWKQYQEQRPTREQLTTWLTDGPYTGIGVITGTASSNVEMVEIENRAIVNGSLEFLSDISRRSNIDSIWNAVLQGCSEQSGGGGLHMFIRLADQPVPGNLKLANNRNNEVLAETRGEGGFVIVAPTPGRTGHHSHYQLLPGSHPTRTPTLTIDERDELHHLIRTLDDSPTRTPEPTPEPRPTTPHTGLTPGDDYSQRTNWADLLIPNGWTQLNSATRNGHPITWWTRPGKNEGVSASTGGEGDWLYVFSSSTTLPDNQPLTKFYVYAHYNHDNNFHDAASQLAREGYGTPLTPISDLAPWEYDPTTGRLDATSDEAADYVKSHLQQLDWHAIWADETEEEWIVEPLLPARRLIALYSAPKVGKSLLMLELAAAVATGRPILGRTPTRRHVLYVDFENDPLSDIRTRLQDMGYKPEDLDYLHYLSYPSLAALDSEKGSVELLAAVLHYEAEAVFIDTVSRSVQGEENENDTWLKFYRHTGLKLKQAGVALMRLDHSGKDESKGQRGGSAKVGDVDAVWRMKRVRGEAGDSYLLECEAHRFQLEPDQARFMIERHTDPLRHELMSGAVDEYDLDIARWASLLDGLECELDISRGKAQEELKEAGYSPAFRHSKWPDICKRRKETLRPFKLVPVPEVGDRNPVPKTAGTGGDEALSNG